MSYDSRVFVQDSTTGRSASIIDALVFAASSVPYTNVDAAVAYATRRGVRTLDRYLGSNRWTNASKRFLVSIDFGVTEPAALDELATLQHSVVRVPGATEVLSNQWLRPRVTFHTKSYVFRRQRDAAPLAIVIGSANLSDSALLVGGETVVAQTWTGTLNASEEALRVNANDMQEWFDQAWNRAAALADVIDEYRNRFVPGRRAELVRDDETELATIVAEEHPVATPRDLADFATAHAVWIETKDLYQNLGVGNPGNQVDAKRGTRVFFGFTPASVPPNHHFGHVFMQVPGHGIVERALRFGDNSMDKINLPAPGVDGPATYDNQFVVFERAGSHNGVPLFQLMVLDQAGLDARRVAASRAIDLHMQSGRRYGLLFS